MELNLIRPDDQIFQLICVERQRQNQNLDLIASENVASPAVLATLATPLTNKYAEGTPYHRYYGGCGVVDAIEQVAIDRAKQIFGAEHANVQPHSGADANAAVYCGLLNAGDTVISMKLEEGGHLTHGNRTNNSGKYHKFYHYNLSPDTERIDYDGIDALAAKHHPKLIIAGASAYPRQIDFERIGNIAKKHNALFMVDMSHIAGLVATGLHPSPVPYADIVTSTTHKTLRGPRGGIILCKQQFAKNIDKGVFPGTQGGPHMNTIAAKAVCFYEAMQPEFQEYQQRVINNAKALAEELQKNFKLVTNGTDNHLLLIDLRPIGKTGLEVEQLLSRANITVNKNTVPGDQQKPFITSGIRIGTPAATSRGITEQEIRQIGEIITDLILHGETAVHPAQQQVAKILDKHPLPYV